MSNAISQRELRNQSGDIMRRLDEGESFVVTRNGVPVGELTPLRRQRFVAAETVAPFSFKRLWERSQATGRLYGAPLGGFWMHVGDPAARDEAEARLTQARAP